MNAYVIGISPELDADPLGYWDGHEQVEDIGSAQVYASAGDARLARNGIQSSFSSQDVILIPVTVTITPRKKGT